MLVARKKITDWTMEAISKVTSEFCMAILAPEEIHAKKRLAGITATGLKPATSAAARPFQPSPTENSFTVW